MKDFLVNELKNSLDYKDYKDLAGGVPDRQQLEILLAKFKRLKKTGQLAVGFISFYLLTILFLCLLRSHGMLSGLITFALSLIPVMIMGVFFNKQFSNCDKSIFILNLLKRFFT
ncbi:MAG TPA: hypothetical protein VE912_09780 [Bacteroidales bacterium]|nr:hypothetical protein [Bacteroidales bacterium]